MEDWMVRRLVNEGLVLFNGDLGRLNYRKHCIALFEIRSLH